MGNRSVQENQKPFEAIVTTRGQVILGQHPHKAIIYVWTRKHPESEITAKSFPELFAAIPDLRIAATDSYVEREVTVCSEKSLRHAKVMLARALRKYTNLSVITQ